MISASLTVDQVKNLIDIQTNQPRSQNCYRTLSSSLHGPKPIGKMEPTKPSATDPSTSNPGEKSHTTAASKVRILRTPSRDASPQQSGQVTVKRPRLLTTLLTNNVTSKPKPLEKNATLGNVPLVQGTMANVSVTPQMNPTEIYANGPGLKMVLPPQAQGKTIILQMAPPQSAPILLPASNNSQAPITLIPNFTHLPLAATSPAPAIVPKQGQFKPPAKETVIIIDDENTVSCKLCKEKFKTNSELEEHIPQHLLYRPFICVLCDSLFESEKENQAHLLEKHLNTPFKCKGCSFILPSGNKLAHMGDHISDTFYKCQPCGEKVDGRKLNDHVMKHMPDEPYQCLFCPEKGKDRQMIDDHMKNHPVDNIQPCSYCLKECSEEDITQHMALHEWDNPYTCKDCCENYQTTSGLKDHITRKHFTILNECLCSLCPAKFSNRKSMMEHVLKEHSQTYSECQVCCHFTEGEITLQHVGEHTSQLNRCRDCGLTLLNEFDLYEHLGTHLGREQSEKPKCVMCQKTFSTTDELVLHDCGDPKEKNSSLKCQFCEDILPSRHDLFVHVATHTSVQHYMCRCCNQHLDDREDLLSHVQCHYKKSNPLRCFLCQDIVTDITAFRQHIMGHFLQVAGKCCVCQVDISPGTDVKMHTISHLVKRYYTCIFCREELSHPRFLSDHVRKEHPLLKPYSCTDCDSKFPSIDALQGHVKAHVTETFDKKGKNKEKSLGSVLNGPPSPVPGHSKEEPMGGVETQKTSVSDLSVPLDFSPPTASASLTPTSAPRTRRVFPRSLEMDDDDNNQPGDGDNVLPGLPPSSSSVDVPASEPMESSSTKTVGSLETSTDVARTGQVKARKDVIYSLKCSLCSGSFTKDDYENHLETHMDCREYQCEVCKCELSSEQFMMDHILSNHVSDFVSRCKVCLKTLSDEMPADHMTKHLSKEYYRCKPCREVFSREGQEEHIRLHTKDLTYQCIFCDENGPEKRKIANHMKAHSEKELECRICNELIKKDFIPYHMKEHAWEKPIQCAICIKEFKSMKEVDQHISKVHTSPLKSIHCGICKARFSNNKQLSMHVVAMHSEYGRKCQTCDRMLPRSTNIQAHVKGHLVRLNKCKHCKKLLESEEKLYYHLLDCLLDVSVQDDGETAQENTPSEKPGKCLVCDTQVASLKKLIEHMSIHIGGVIPGTIQCPSCTEKFKTLQEFLTHSENHLNSPKSDPNASRKVSSTNILPTKIWSEGVERKTNLQKSDSQVKASEENSVKKDTGEVDVIDITDECDDDENNREVSADGKTSEKPKIPSRTSTQTDAPRKKCHRCTNCDAAFDNVADLLDHGTKHLEKNGPIQFVAGFTCVMCKKSFNSESKLKEHIPSHLTAGLTICQVCGEQVRGADLKSHVVGHLESTYFTCIFCLDLLLTEGDLDKHYASHVVTLPVQCRICGVNIVDILNLQMHFKIHVKRSANGTQALPQVQGIQQNLQQALALPALVGKAVHQGFSPTPVASSSGTALMVKPEGTPSVVSAAGGFPTSAPTLQGLRSIVDQKLIAAATVKPQALARTAADPKPCPQTIVHKEIAFFEGNVEGRHLQCKYCFNTYFTTKALTQHQRTHEYRPRTCPVCRRVYRSNKLLHLHMKQHSNQRYYTCTVCKTSVISKNYLLIHLRTHGLSTGVACDVCLTGFKDRSHFQNHLCDIKKKGPFSCSMCGRAYPSKKRLDEHVRSHFESRRYVCLKCDKRFRDRKVYEFHSKQCKRPEGRASSNRLYQCGLCNIFVDGYIAEHLQTHSKPSVDKTEKDASVQRDSKDTDTTASKSAKAIHQDYDTGNLKGGGARSDNPDPALFLGPTPPQDEDVEAAVEEMDIVSEGPELETEIKTEETNALKTDTNSKGEEKLLIVHGCRFCPKLFPDKTSLQDHIRTHDTGVKPDTLQLYMNRSRPSDRVQIYPNSDGKYECDTCGKVVNSRRKIIRHLPVHLPVKKFQCAFCAKGFNTKRQVEVHERSHTKERPFKCPQCPKDFRGSYNLKLHMETHNTSTPFECKDCGSKFKTKRLLQYHQKVVHLGLLRRIRHEKSLCPHCPKTFLSKYSLDNHIKYTHSGEPMLPCEICGKQFKNPKLLKLHSLVHEERKYSCELCGVKIRTKSHLGRHMKGHYGEKQFSCEVCGRGFFEQGPLNQHMRIHTGERPYKCTKCNRAFRTNTCLKNHMMVHVEDRPYKCSICGAGCKSKDRLRTHEKRHLQPKEKIPCSLCSKVFASHGSLNIHIKEVHEGRKEECGVCGAKFRRTLQLEQHMLKVHPEVDFQLRERSSLLDMPQNIVVEEQVVVTENPEEAGVMETVEFDGTITDTVFECGLCKLLITGDVHQHLVMHQETDLLQGEELVIQTQTQ